MKAASKQPFANWLESQMLRLPNIIAKERAKGVRLTVELDDTTISTDPKLLAFGYTFEQLDLLLRPLVNGASSFFVCCEVRARADGFVDSQMARRLLDQWCACETELFCTFGG